MSRSYYISLTSRAVASFTPPVTWYYAPSNMVWGLLDVFLWSLALKSHDVPSSISITNLVDCVIHDVLLLFHPWLRRNFWTLIQRLFLAGRARYAPGLIVCCDRYRVRGGGIGDASFIDSHLTRSLWHGSAWTSVFIVSFERTSAVRLSAGVWTDAEEVEVVIMNGLELWDSLECTFEALFVQLQCSDNFILHIYPHRLQLFQ